MCTIESKKADAAGRTPFHPIPYNGEMSHEARAKALEEFSDPKGKTNILVASLRCGGLGLNLTAASRVILLDPWWNRAIEQQV